MGSILCCSRLTCEFLARRCSEHPSGGKRGKSGCCQPGGAGERLGDLQESLALKKEKQHPDSLNTQAWWRQRATVSGCWPPVEAWGQCTGTISLWRRQYISTVINRGPPSASFWHLGWRERLVSVTMTVPGWPNFAPMQNFLPELKYCFTFSKINAMFSRVFCD